MTAKPSLASHKNAPVLYLLILSFLFICPCPALGASAFSVAIQDVLAGKGVVSPEADASGAVDGKITGKYSFHTGKDNPPWWQVDLGKPQPMGHVRIHSPHVSERLSRFNILASNDGQSWKVVHTHGPATNRIKKFEVPLEGVSGRYLRIRASSATWMHLDEVLVFSPGNKKKNIALRKPCTQSSASEWSSRPPIQMSDIDWRHEFKTGESVINSVLLKIKDADDLQKRCKSLVANKVALDDARWEVLYKEAVARSRRWNDLWQQFELLDLAALSRALEDLHAHHGERYGDIHDLRRRLAAHRRSFSRLKADAAANRRGFRDEAEALVAFQRDILLRNPLLDFQRMVLIRRRLGSSARKAMGSALGIGTLNSHTNDSLRRTGWDNHIAAMTHHRSRPVMKKLYDSGGHLITDLEVDFDASRMMFSSTGGKQPNWRIFEMALCDDPSSQAVARQLTPDDGVDVGHFDSCYMGNPNEIIFCSTAAYQGLPCEYGSKRMTCLFKLDRLTGGIRQLTFEQDSDWSPTAMHDGRIMYLRWEYSDLPHSNSRILFQMRPDGRMQMEHYGSGSYFMPSYFYARPIPGHDSKVVGIATGHHGTPRSGRLIIVDPELGRREAQGVVQEIPGWGRQVAPEVRDRLADFYWPHFLHPYPLSEKYFITAMKPAPGALWGIYLVDIFDNITLLYQEEGCALLDPIPLIKRERPCIIPDTTINGEKNATVFLSDIYSGDGLKDVPRGTVKKLRIGTYYFSSHGTGGLLGSIGSDGPWDIKRVLGTVPVEADGSACFKIPANTPIFLQPLDREGKALQLMRSWFVGMPGETVSCAGCHEDQKSVVANRQTSASLRPPSLIRRDEDVVRGFSFPHDVQPVLDRYCLACHNGSDPSRLPDIPGIAYPANITRDQDNGEGLVDLRGDAYIKDWKSGHGGNCGGGAKGGNFPLSYVALERYVRRNGIEGPLRMLSPGEFHADTTELVQMLRNGRHYNVRLDAESWRKLITWIDLNAPCHGTWCSVGTLPAQRVKQVNQRRIELARLYANIDIDFELQPPLPAQPGIELPSSPDTKPAAEPPVKPAGWPFSRAEAIRKQGKRSLLTVNLSDDVAIEMVYIPKGNYINGRGRKIAVDKAFWMARYETTNEQMRLFEADFDARREDRYGYQFGRLCYGMNGDEMAAVRIDWHKAVAFCRWLSERTGRPFRLPSEDQWEWACRAGAQGEFWFGRLGDDFTAYANLGDVRLVEFAANTNTGGYTTTSLIRNPGKYDDRIPRDRTFDDGVFLTNRFPRNEKGVMLSEPLFQAERPEGLTGMAQAGRFKPNPWGLYDMHGNVWEWTSSESEAGRKVACGGSFYDRPKRCTAGSRIDYKPYHKVFNVGFRVICD